MNRLRPRLRLLLGTFALGLAAATNALAHDGDKNHNGADQKIAELTEDLKNNPNDFDALRQRGYLYLMVQDEVENGLADFKRVVEIKPTYESGHACLAIALYRQDDLRAALAIVNTLCAAASTIPSVWATRGQIRHELGDDKGALADWDQALAVTPKKWPLAFTDRGLVKLALGDEAGALDDWKHALAMDPRHVDTLLVRARFHGERGHWEEASADLDAAAEYSRGRIDGRSHAERAVIWRRKPFLLEAEQEANTALELLRREVDLSRSPAQKAKVLLEMARVCAEARHRPRLALEVIAEAEKLCAERPDLARYRVKLTATLGDEAMLAAAREHLAAVAKTKLPDGALEVAAIASEIAAVGSGG